VSGARELSRTAREAERLHRARLLIARGNHVGALKLLDRPHETPEGANWRRQLEALTLRGLALWANNEKTQAIDVAGQALALGEPEGYVRTFVDEGPAMTASYPRYSRRGSAEPPLRRTRLRRTTSGGSWRRWSGTPRAPPRRQRGCLSP
jgi:LuxR family maltose regulon positive regulatory protein